MMVKFTQKICLASLLGLAASTAMANDMSLKNMSEQVMPVIYELACYHGDQMVEYSQQYETIIPAHGGVHVPVNADEHGCEQAGVVIKAVGVGSFDHLVAPASSEDMTDPMHDPMTDTDPMHDPMTDTDPMHDPMTDTDPMHDPMTDTDPVHDPVVDPVHHDDNVYHVNAHWEYLPEDSTQFAQTPGCWVAVSQEHTHGSIDLMNLVMGTLLAT